MREFALSIRAPYAADTEASVEFVDPNKKNLVEHVSCKAPKTYKPDSGNTKLRIIAVDVGMVWLALLLLFWLPCRSFRKSRMSPAPAA